MSESMFWPSVVLVGLNLAAVALWLGTLRLRLVLSTGPRACAGARRPAARQDGPSAPSIDSVEQQLVENIRQWRASCATTGVEPAGGLEHWIAEVDRDERRTGTGGILPGSRRDPADPAASSGKKRPWRGTSSMARSLTGSRVSSRSGSATAGS